MCYGVRGECRCALVVGMRVVQCLPNSHHEQRPGHPAVQLHGHKRAVPLCTQCGSPNAPFTTMHKLSQGCSRC